MEATRYYFVKKVLKSKSGETQTYYVGCDGRSYDNTLYEWKGWRHKRFADEYVEKSWEWERNEPSDSHWKLQSAEVVSVIGSFRRDWRIGG